MKTSIMVIIAVAVLTATAAFPSSFTLYAENDFFYNTDKDYTHGTKLSYRTDDEFEFYLWQGIYTPKNKTSETVEPGDRPYAGWLAVGFGKQYYFGQLWNFTEVSIGVVGPSSLSEQSQTQIHKMIGDDVPNGWDDQLDDEPALMVRHEFRRPIWLLRDKISVAAVPQAEIAAGTVMDYVGIGGDIVFGMNPSPNFVNQISMKGVGSKYAIYGFVGVRGRAVAWNMLLDGNIYHDSPSVDREVLTGDFQCGVCVAAPWGSVTYTSVTRSKEFKTQDKAEKFGCVALTVYF